MSLLKIEQLGAEVLRRRAEEVQEIGEDLRLLIEDMFETMYEAQGVGLAGPQVGVSRRVIVVDVREEGTEPLALINPRIVESSRETEKDDEGCLSIPGLSAAVTRASRVVVEGLDAEGHPVQITGEGLLGRCLQHEIDHLDGVLFLDRLSPLKRNMLLKKWKNTRPVEAESGARPGTVSARAGARGQNSSPGQGQRAMSPATGDIAGPAKDARGTKPG